MPAHVNYSVFVASSVSLQFCLVFVIGYYYFMVKIHATIFFFIVNGRDPAWDGVLKQVISKYILSKE
jgi:hypothetical protein